jgi:hypothetical protein
MEWKIKSNHNKRAKRLVSLKDGDKWWYYQPLFSIAKAVKGGISQERYIKICKLQEINIEKKRLNTKIDIEE